MSRNLPFWGQFLGMLMKISGSYFLILIQVLCILSLNNLTGTIPPELGKSANLKRIDLYSNNLTGNIPPELGDLAHLEGLHLYDNQLTGNIPPEMRERMREWARKMAEGQDYELAEAFYRVPMRY